MFEQYVNQKFVVFNIFIAFATFIIYKNTSFNNIYINLFYNKSRMTDNKKVLRKMQKPHTTPNNKSTWLQELKKRLKQAFQTRLQELKKRLKQEYETLTPYKILYYIRRILFPRSFIANFVVYTILSIIYIKIYILTGFPFNLIPESIWPK